MTKLSKQQFFSVLAPSAILARMQGSLILPSVRLAYAFEKSSSVIIAWNNVTDNKVDEGNMSPFWTGEYINKNTRELKQQRGRTEKEALRAYRTMYHGFKDEDEFYLRKNKRALILAKTPYAQIKSIVKIRKENDELVEQLMGFIQLYQLEYYDQIQSLYDLPANIKKSEIIPVMYDDELFAIAFIVDEFIYISLRKMQDSFPMKVDKSNGILRINGHIVKSFTQNQLTYVNVEELKMILLFQVEWDHHAKVLFLY